MNEKRTETIIDLTKDTVNYNFFNVPKGDLKEFAENMLAILGDNNKNDACLFQALYVYITDFCERDVYSIENILKMVNAAAIADTDIDSSAKSPLDIMFEATEAVEADSYAVLLYRIWKALPYMEQMASVSRLAYTLSEFKLKRIQASEEDAEISEDREYIYKTSFEERLASVMMMHKRAITKRMIHI